MLVLLMILKILLYILLLILGLLLLLLIIPFNYSGQVLSADRFRLQLGVGWAWKLLGINAEVEGDEVAVTLQVLNRKVYRLKSREAKEDYKEDKLPDKRVKEKRSAKGFSLKEFTDKALINEIIAYFKRVLDIAKPKYLHLYGTYGFDDPSVTGIVCGITGIITSMIPHAKLQLTPDFTQEIMDVDVRIEGSMAVGSLAYQTVRTVLKKPVRKILFKKKKS